MASPEDETTAGNAAEASASREDAPASASAAAEPSTGTLVGADEEDAMFTTGRRSDMTDKLTLANGTVSLVEVRAFRASIPARRFPSLRHMTDEQIATIIAKDKDARSKQPWDKTTQSSNHMDDFWCSKTAAGSQPKSPKRRLRKSPAPAFSPCNSRAARDTIARKERFLTVGTQYDEGMKQYLSMKAFDESKRLAAPFKPNSASQAKNMTSIKYFMNSPREGDAATLPAFMKSTL